MVSHDTVTVSPNTGQRSLPVGDLSRSQPSPVTPTIVPVNDVTTGDTIKQIIYFNFITIM